jgi:hypothetical protein
MLLTEGRAATVVGRRPPPSWSGRRADQGRRLKSLNALSARAGTSALGMPSVTRAGFTTRHAVRDWQDHPFGPVRGYEAALGATAQLNELGSLIS